VGKTTSVFNLAVALGRLGRRVLMIDLDSLAAVTRACGVLGAGDLALPAVLAGHHPLASIVVETVFAHVWIAPSSPSLVALEYSPDACDSRRRDDGGLTVMCLAREIPALQDEFDYCLLDCPSGHLFMEQVALMAADEVIIPTGASVIDLYGAAPTLQLVALAQQARGDGRPSLLGFLPNEVEKSGVPQGMGQALERYGLPSFTPIRNSALLRSLPGSPRLEDRSIVIARPGNPAALTYMKVAGEIDTGIPVMTSANAAPDGLEARQASAVEAEA
jgi:cellulose biosynthesis protein BcsQ